MIPWALSFDYFDQATNRVQFIKAAPGEEAYAEYWGTFLKDFSRHLRDISNKTFSIIKCVLEMLTGVGCYDTIHGQHCVGKTKIRETFMGKLHDLKFFAKPLQGKDRRPAYRFRMDHSLELYLSSCSRRLARYAVANWAFFISVTIFFMHQQQLIATRTIDALWVGALADAIGNTYRFLQSYERISTVSFGNLYIRTRYPDDPVVWDALT